MRKEKKEGKSVFYFPVCSEAKRGLFPILNWVNKLGWDLCMLESEVTFYDG